MTKVYFIGIGGIGMSALAQLLKERGDEVVGSDRAVSPVTELLQEKGIEVLIGQRAENVPSDATLVVYSDAVGEDNPERVRAREFAIPQLSYFEMLGQIARSFPHTIAVAGTHGKTTTTGMLAAILKESGAAPTAIVGSIVQDFRSNYLAGGESLFVVEACEYRNHLLELAPEILVINNLEWDHTDFFASLTELQETFRKAIARVPAHGAVITDPEHPHIAPLVAGIAARVIDYTKEYPAGYDAPSSAFSLMLPGEFNQMNARAAAAAARAYSPQISHEHIAHALANFHGTWRRFEYKGKTKNLAEVYDDYAHHPTAVKETLRALRAKTKGKVFVAFHPHLYSRTRDLLDGFAGAFGDADEVLIAPIYAAREVDDGSVSSELLAERIRSLGGRARALKMDEVETVLAVEPQEGDVIMTMGAGDIYQVADRLVK